MVPLTRWLPRTTHILHLNSSAADFQQAVKAYLVLEFLLGDIMGYKQPVYGINLQSLYFPPFSLRGVGPRLVPMGPQIN